MTDLFEHPVSTSQSRLKKPSREDVLAVVFGALAALVSWWGGLPPAVAGVFGVLGAIMYGAFTEAPETRLVIRGAHNDRRPPAGEPEEPYSLSVRDFGVFAVKLNRGMWGVFVCPDSRLDQAASTRAAPMGPGDTTDTNRAFATRLHRLIMRRYTDAVKWGRNRCVVDLREAKETVRLDMEAEGLLGGEGGPNTGPSEGPGEASGEGPSEAPA
jgi:hypothetical protein